MEKINQWLGSFNAIIKKLISGFLLLSVFLNCKNVYALSLISDEETEVFLHQTLRPIFQAANITFYPSQIFIVNDKSLNAFVADGNRMFVNIGTIVTADSQNELTGVLAHETGHIQGGHILRHKIQAQEIQSISLASMLVGGLAGIAAGRADISIAAILGSQSSALNSLLSYQISEERSADEAAINLLKKINQSPMGMLRFLEKIKQNNKTQGIAERDYFRTHPLTDERISFVAKAANESNAPLLGQNEKEFQRIKAKLFAFTEDPKQTFLKYPLSDNSIPARYAHAIAWFKQPDIDKATEAINSLIDEEPNNPYFYELKGQMMLETGNIKDAVKAYKQALSLQPNSSLFKLNLAQAMLENNPNIDELNNIVQMLLQVLVYNPDNSYGWLLLARTYGLQNNLAGSAYASAEFNLLTGDIVTARRQAQRAIDNKPSTTLRLKIDDLMLRIKQIEKKQK